MTGVNCYNRKEVKATSCSPKNHGLVDLLEEMETILVERKKGFHNCACIRAIPYDCLCQCIVETAY